MQGVRRWIRSTTADGARSRARARRTHHEELGFWRKYVFSMDHKVIGIQYAITGLLFLLFGFTPDDDHAVAAGLSGPARFR